MKLSGNTILITGGGSGIGLGLAEEFLKRGNEVIVAGRSREKLTAAEKKGLKTLTVDMTSGSSIQELALSALKQFPKLNVVIHNAGIMKNENLRKGAYPDIEEETVLTNLLGPMRLTDALLPHFLQQTSAAIITVTSGLAYVPLAMTPTYCATKAAIHSYTQSLRYQLKGSSVEVKELVPPYLRTHLMGERQSKDEFAMPLEEFLSEVMQILTENPEAEEILVKRVLPQRQAADQGQEKYREFFHQMNDRLFAARKEEW
jgi:uncharacterized oxidoreductase